MKVYTAKTVARLLDLPVGTVRAYARTGLLEADRGPRGEYRFSFHDLVLLRTAKGLITERIAPRKIRRALERLRHQLPRGRPLSGVRISAVGDRVLVSDGSATWDPDSGQVHLNFDVADLLRKVTPHGREAGEREPVGAADDSRNADHWYTIGAGLETTSPGNARRAYRRALDLDPGHVETRVNLGRLLHEEGKLHAAEAHYRLALAVRPQDPTALFNLAVCIEDQGLATEAIDLYRRTIDADPGYADAYFNLARLHEKRGDSALALRLLKTYRKLTETR